MADTNFDALFERFQSHITGHLKGQIREEIIKTRLEKYCPQLNAESLNCADIGGGLGQMSQWLAKKGHRVDYCDISQKMAQRARETTAPELANNIRIRCGAFQDTLNETYNFVHCQAVLEWLELPLAGLEKLSALCTDEATLSIVFYNKASIILRNLIRGNLKAALGDVRGNGAGLTPINPLEFHELEQKLNALGFEIRHWYGARCFTDYQSRDIQARLGLTSLLDAELQVCERDPFRANARYIGLIASRKTR